MTVRFIRAVRRSQPTIEGAGVHLKRAFGYSEVPQFDPFLMLDDFHSSKPEEYLPGFPWHPHRGIETITYILQGVVQHSDSMGNQGAIGAGDIQWMTAGSGIIHQEMPRKTAGGVMWGFQFWANLPARHKMMSPRYRDIKAADVPTVSLGPVAQAKIICGEVNGVRGPVRDVVIDPEFLDVSVAPSSGFTHAVKPGYTVFAYVLEGVGHFDPRKDAFAHEAYGTGWADVTRSCACGPESVVLYEPEGDQIAVTSGKETLRFLLISGKPLGEPVAWYGPIVMNTQDELRVAFEELEKGSFVKHPG